MELKEKLLELNEYAKDNSVEDIIFKIHKLFPYDETEYQKINVDRNYYLDHRELIYLPNTTNSYIQIVYPGMDYYGSTFSHDKTDIMIKYVGMIDPIYIIKDSKYVDDDNLIENIDRILINRPYTKEEIKEELLDPYHNNYHDYALRKYQIFSKLTPSQKQDDEIIKATFNYLKDCARSLANEVYEDIEYGRFGGLNIADWESSEAKQFERLIQDNFPNIEENKKMITKLSNYYRSSQEKENHKISQNEEMDYE